MTSIPSRPMNDVRERNDGAGLGRDRVVLVGAGPAGLTIGFMLARAEIPFVILERRSLADVGGPPKAGSIDYRTVELLTTAGVVCDSVRFETRNGVCEFRTPEEQVIFDYGAWTGDRPHYIYPQHLLVEAMCAELLRRGGEIQFGATVTGVEHTPVGASVELASGERLAASAVVGCDGARSTVAGVVSGVDFIEESIPARLLAVIGHCGPLVDRTVYAAHPQGYAAQMRRTPQQTRFYLEARLEDTADDWPEDRVRCELAERLLAGSALDDVRFTDWSFVDLKMRMPQTMQDRHVFLVGDAAHVITPFGGKGMNLAIGDAVELASGLIEAFAATPDRSRLDAYSTTRLPILWRTQAFSNWMLRTALAGAPLTAAASGPFAYGIGRGWISALQHDPLFARWFAHAYAGADPL